MVGSESLVLVRFGTGLGFIAAGCDNAAVRRLRVGESLLKLSTLKSAWMNISSETRSLFSILGVPVCEDAIVIVEFAPRTSWTNTHGLHRSRLFAFLIALVLLVNFLGMIQR